MEHLSFAFAFFVVENWPWNFGVTTLDGGSFHFCNLLRVLDFREVALECGPLQLCNLLGCATLPSNDGEWTLDLGPSLVRIFLRLRP